MAWKAYKLSYRVMSPIHIGWHTLGYIKLTRHYITGKNIWGAMTANITRALRKYEDYGEIGKLLKEDILTSYFFPAVDPDSPLLLRFTDKGLMYGEKPAADFERIFIKSYGQTAVVPHSNTAEDESLHESEFISPVIYDEENNNQCPVFFVGYIFISDDGAYKWDDIKTAISEIFVGGDRKYGWGRLLLDDEKTREVKDSMVFGNTLVSDDKGLKIEIEKENSIPAHLGVNNELNLKGDIEPLVGMDFENNKGFGQNVSKAEICWVPGSVAADKMTLKIGAYGIMEKGDNHG